MGASSSSNVSNETINAITDVSTSIMNNSSAKSLQTQSILVECVSSEDTPCDIVISDITQTASATVDMSAVMTSMNSSSAQQDLISQLTQSASSITSGINLAQFSDANNEMFAYLSASIDIATNISQECSASIDQQQSITVNVQNGGNITITDVTQKQFADIWSQCLLNSINSSTAVQDLQNTVDQSASAKSQGISEWALVAMMICGLLVIVVPIAVGGSELISAVTKLFFPIIFVTGAVLMYMYYSSQGTSVAMYSMSKGFKEKAGCTTSSSYDTTTKYAQPTDVADDIKSDPNKEYIAFDWQGWTVGTDGSLTQLDTPVTTLYRSLASKDCTPDTDDTKLYERPTFSVAATCATDAQDGDICINTGDGHTYIFEEGSGWIIANTDWADASDVKNGAKVVFDLSSPTSSDTADYWLVTSNPSQIALWTKAGGSWSNTTTYTKSDSAPGYRVTMPIYYLPDKSSVDGITNTSGKLITTKKSWMLTIAIICMVVGFLGSMFSFMGGSKKNKKSSSSVKSSPPTTSSV
jgi:hypothetical protein